MTSSSAHAVATVAPNLLVTVTVEAGSDGDEIHIHAGGQGFWVARMVHLLGVRSTICAPLGGEPGRVLRGLIEAENLDVEAVRVHGANGSYVDDRRDGERRRIAQAPGSALTRHEQDDFYGAALASALAARTAILTGPQPADAVPPAFYERLAGDLRTNNIFVVADLADEALDAALAGGLDLLKVSDEELAAADRLPDTARESVARALWDLRDRGARNALVSRSGEPALALIGERLIELIPPRLEALDEAGAGDSMTAAVASARARGVELEDALRLGVAAGSLNVSRRGLGSGRREDIEKVAAQVEIQEL